MGLVVLLVLSLATARITRLVVEDTIFDKPRNALQAKLLVSKKGSAAWLLKLIGCPYCVSVWVALAATVTTFALADISIPNPVAVFIFLWMAIAALAVIAYQLFG